MIICPYCQGEARLVDGRAVYPNRRDLWDKPVWACLPCRAWVGCHPDTEVPLGRLADSALRAAKMAAHAAFDPIWREGRMTRKAAYRWLAAQMGIREADCHIGHFDLKQCKAVVDAVVRAAEQESSA